MFYAFRWKASREEYETPDGKRIMDYKELYAEYASHLWALVV